MEDRKALARFITTMVIFGTIGIFRRWIPVSSAFLAFVRGLIGSMFLLLFSRSRRQDTDHTIPLKQKLLWFGIPGIFIGLNWVLLFEAYRYTSVPVATLCYYMAPTIVILLSPLVFKEKLTSKKLLCAVTAVIGMILISGVFSNHDNTGLTGIVLGLGAALLYSMVIMVNKKAPQADVYEKTTIELAAAAAILFPYILLSEGFSLTGMTLPAVMLIITVGIVHTGVAYALYFASIPALKAQTAALFSYIDPVTALLLSALLLHEPLTGSGIIGAVLILGSAIVSEL
ncbi:MAG: DMT family transporter [Solobacterium sp.]|nr:DMT family transporter [Solobacterium sp.]